MAVTGAPDYQQPFENELAHLEHHRALEGGVLAVGPTSLPFPMLPYAGHWDAGTAYAVDDVVAQYDGTEFRWLAYRAAEATTGDDPAGGGPWELMTAPALFYGPEVPIYMTGDNDTHSFDLSLWPRGFTAPDGSLFMQTCLDASIGQTAGGLWTIAQSSDDIREWQSLGVKAATAMAETVYFEGGFNRGRQISIGFVGGGDADPNLVDGIRITGNGVANARAGSSIINETDGDSTNAQEERVITRGGVGDGDAKAIWQVNRQGDGDGEASVDFQINGNAGAGRWRMIAADGGAFNVITEGIPTADPHIAGALWNNAGTLKVSAGA